MSFQIVVDSCCDLTPAMMADGCFTKVPLTIYVDGKTFVDDESLVQSDLLWHMKQCKTASTTSCPSPQMYADACDCGADEVYVVTLSAMLSGSHNSAVQGSNLLLEEKPNLRIHVFNSCSAVSGEVLTALKIRELAQAGLPFEQVVAEVEQYIYEMKTLFVLENLDNLRKNGRLTRLQSIVTSTLRLKLFLGSTPEGEICKLGQALTVKQGLARMVDFIAADETHRGRDVVITHCNCLDRAFSVRESLQARCAFHEILLCETHGLSTFYADDGGIVVAY